MMFPLILLMMSIFSPIIGITWTLGISGGSLDTQHERLSGIVASITTFVSTALILLLTQFQTPELEVLNSHGVISLSEDVHWILLHDKLASFWTLLTSGMVSCILLDRRQRLEFYEATTSTICLLGALLVSQFAFLSSHAVLQWTLVGLSNWLFWSGVNLSDDTRENLKLELLVTLTLADFFWMLGLIGIYFSTGTLELVFLREQGAFANLSQVATNLLTTSVLSMMFGLLLRLGMFPFMTWGNRCLKSTLSTLWLLSIPVSLGVFLLIRWHPVLTAFPEPRTFLIGITGLSAILLPLSALFYKGTKRLMRLLSVPVSLIAIGLCVNPLLWSQMASLFAGTLVLAVTILSNEERKFSHVQTKVLWGMICLLVCGTLGVQTVLSGLQSEGATQSFQVPPVMLPLMVLAIGLFLFGMRDLFSGKFASGISDDSTESNSVWLGFGAMVLVSLLPFTLQPVSSYEFQLPFLILPVFALVVLIAVKLPPMTKSATPELGSLFQMCQNDYYIETIFERGIAIPLDIFASLLHFFDKLVLRGFTVALPRWIQKEVSETTQLIEDEQSEFEHLGLILLAAVVLIGVVLFV